MDQVPVLEVNEVFKSFKDVKAVRGISLSIRPGQFTALLGPNGAGKTTLVEMVEGIQKPDKGDIRLFGKHWKGNEDELHRMIGLSLQETQFIDKLSVRETLKLFAGFFDLGRKRVDEVIELVGLEEKEKAYVVNLSGGQRQKLALGISLLNKPRILLLDEPTTGLDPNARREVWEILRELRKSSDTSMVLTTHYMEEAEQLCDYIIIIDHGIILKEGNISQLLESDDMGRIMHFSLEVPLTGELPAGLDIFNIQWDPARNKGALNLNNFERELPDFLKHLNAAGLRIKNMEFRRSTLDDLFISLTGRHLHD